MPEPGGEETGPSDRWQRIDLAHFAVAAAGLAVAMYLAMRGEPSSWEVRLFRLVNRLPGTVSAPLTGAMQLGALTAVGVVAVGAAVVRRPRLARAVLISGSGSWLLAKVLVPVVGRHQPGDVLDRVIVRGHVLANASFPSTHCAVAAAVAVAAAPYLGRFGRRSCGLGVLAVAVSRLYVGAQFPLDALGGIALGAAVAAAVTSVLGNEHARFSGPRVARVLAERDISVGALVPWRQGLNDTLFVGEAGPDLERRLVRIASRHEHGNGWLARLWRIVAFRDATELGPLRPPRERNEHTALMSTLAERAGIATPRLCALRDVGAEYSLAVYTMPMGRLLTELSHDELDRSLLIEVWHQVDALHSAGVNLGILDGHDIVVDDGRRRWFAALGNASLGEGAVDLARDNAETLIGLALVCDPEVVCEAAASVIGIDGLSAAAMHLQPLELAVATRRRLRCRPELLARCRAAAAALTGADEPAITPVARVAARNVAVLVGGAVAVNVLLTQVGHATRTLEALHRPEWVWVAALVGAMNVTYLGAAISMMGATTIRLPLRRTLAVQFAAAFSNRLAPAGLGGMATNVRYLERAGADRPAALGSVTLNAVAGFIVHAVALVAVLPLVGPLPAIDVDPPRSWPLLLAALAVLSVIGVVGWIRYLPPHIGDRLRDNIRALAGVLRSPTRATALFGGSVLVTTAYALALFAALHAFGAHISLPRVLVVYLGASAIAALSPTPGGLGALEAGLVAGLSRVGVSASVAVAGVLGYRLVTYWLPVLPGIVVIRSLRRHGHV